MKKWLPVFKRKNKRKKREGAGGQGTGRQTFSLLAGVLLHWGGWILVNLYCLPFLIITGMILIWYRTRKAEDDDLA